MQIESLSTGLDELRTDVRELRADIKTLRDKMDEGLRAPNAQLDSINTLITKLSKDVAATRSLQKATFWVLGGFASLVTILIIGW